MIFSGIQKRLIWLAVIFTLEITAFAHFLPAQQMNLAFHHLDQGKGLSQGTCSFISRDSKGFVWLATMDGLNRFDGRNVKIYRPDPGQQHGLTGNNVTSACFEDTQTSDLWFTTNDAVHRYVRELDHFDTFQLKDRSGKRLFADYYAFHLDQKGNLWLRVGVDDKSTLHIWNTLTGKDSIVCPLVGSRCAVIPDKTGTIRQLLCSEFPYRQPGLAVIDLDNGLFQRKYFSEGNPAFQVHEVFVENDTLVWLGTSEGIAAFNPQTGHHQMYNEWDSRMTGGVWSTYPYGSRLLMVGTEANGLWVFDRQKRHFIQVFEHDPDNPFSLPDNATLNVFIDRQENLWVADWKTGLSYANLRKNKFYIPPIIKGSTVWRIQKGPDENIWCTSEEKGILIYGPDGAFIDSVHIDLPEIKPKLSFSNKFIYQKEGSRLYYSEYILAWKSVDRTIKYIQKLPFRIKYSTTSQHGKTIVATNKGIFKLAPNNGDVYVFTPVLLKTDLQPSNVTAIFLDNRDYLYISENSESLLIFKETPDGFVFQKKITGTGECKFFYEKQQGQGLWIASTTGLLSIGPDLESRILNETDDGLPNATYYGVTTDNQGRLWLSSNQGLLSYDIAKHTVNRYFPVDGLFGNEFNKGAFFKADDGQIWAGGLGGLIIFNPDSMRNVPFEPQVQFTKLLVNDQEYKTRKQVEVLEFIDLHYDQNTLSLEFVALEFSDPSANQFRYRLVGYDNTWVNSGTRGFVRYANLPPGDYTFEVLAANSDGVWSTVTKSLKIHIQTPFWQTWWFYLLCTIAAAGLIYAWFRYRLMQALKIERMRVQISSDLHDDVGTLLAGLAMQSEALEMTALEKDKSKLQRISEISRSAMAHMRDTVWAIDARKDKLENLVDRMREHAEETLTPRDIRFDIQVENMSLKQNLPTNIRQNIYLIYKEAVTNAAKHTNGDTVNISIKKAGSGMEMRICDNGQTTEKTYKTTGSGTSNMQMRAEKIGGTLEISREEGYCVVLRVG